MTTTETTLAIRTELYDVIARLPKLEARQAVLAATEDAILQRIFVANAQARLAAIMVNPDADTQQLVRATRKLEVRREDLAEVDEVFARAMADHCSTDVKATLEDGVRRYLDAERSA